MTARIEASIATGKEPYTGDETFTVKYHEVGSNKWTYLPGYVKDVDVALRTAHKIEARFNGPIYKQEEIPPQEPECPDGYHWNGRQCLQWDNLIRPTTYEREA